MRILPVSIQSFFMRVFRIDAHLTRLHPEFFMRVFRIDAHLTRLHPEFLYARF